MVLVKLFSIRIFDVTIFPTPESMNGYAIAVFIFLICASAIVLGLGVLKDTNNMRDDPNEKPNPSKKL